MLTRKPGVRDAPAGNDEMIKAENLRLPRVDKPPPNLVLMLIGKALAETYRDAMNQSLPEPLARILREIEIREGPDQTAG